jgi:hypothetical protein
LRWSPTFEKQADGMYLLEFDAEIFSMFLHFFRFGKMLHFETLEEKRRILEAADYAYH